MKIFDKSKLNILRILGVFVIMAITLFGVVQIIQAKYFKNESDNTIASANGFYFSSDYLNEVKNGEISEYMMYGWNGKTLKSFAFKIRNYENPLLFNNEEQTVKYKISYEIPDEFIDKVDVTLYKMVKGEYVTTPLENELTGGASTFNTDEYKLSVTPRDGVEINSDLAVIIRVNTIDAPYSRELVTKVILQYTQYEKFIYSKGIVNNPQADYSVKYSFCTANEANMSEMENSYVKTVTKELDLYWDYKKLSLDRFDAKVSSAIETKKVGEDGITQENMPEYKNVIIIDESTGQAHLFFDALPFSEFNVYFYKEIGLEENVWKDTQDNSKYIWETDEEKLINVIEVEN